MACILLYDKDISLSNRNAAYRRLGVKKWIIAVGITVSSLHMVQAQWVALYTNAPVGATVTLTNTVAVGGAPLNKTNDTTVIAFEQGIGTLEGHGGIIVVNEANNNQSGALHLSGVVASNVLIATDYTGTMKVVNDLSAYSVTNSGAAKANATAGGVLGSVAGDFSSDLWIEAHAGFSGSESNSAEANADAYGIFGDMKGDLLGEKVVVAISGTATSGLGTASAYAQISAISGDLHGNLDGVVSVAARGGQANSSLGRADAFAKAIGINRLDTGTMNGRIEAQAFGGTAVSDMEIALATAEAYGIARGVESNILETATISAMAHGGEASSTNGTAQAWSVATGVGGENGEVVFSSFGQVLAMAEGGDAYAGNGSADATAKAYALADGNVNGVLDGTLTATALGAGTATVTGTGVADASAEAYGLRNGGVQNMLGAVRISATGGTATSGSDARANATAYGIEGGILGDTMSGTIEVAATGGKASGTSSSEAFARAVGIFGASMNISNYTGSITATATGGELDGVARSGQAEAIGIEATSDLTLNVLSGSIVAVATGSNSTAHAILGGAGTDAITLGTTKIIGDIDLQGGGNLLEVKGNTYLLGDIKSTGGTVNFRVENGMLLLSKPVQVSDLTGGTMTFAGDSELTMALTGDPASPANSKLMVDGAVAAPDGVGINAVPFANSPAGETILGKQYEVIQATGVTGTFVEGSYSLFTLDVVNSNNSVWITATGLQPQVAENTPAVANTQKALEQASRVVMDDVSSHIGSVRTMLRTPSGADTVQPEGAQGPDGNTVSARKIKMEKGDWVGYILQLNQMGSQDSTGSMVGYDWDAHGFMVGGEKLISKQLLIGGAAGGMWSSVDGKMDAQDGSSDLLIGSLYGDWIADSWHVELGLSYGVSDSDAARVDTTSQHYDGSFDSTLFGTWLEGGYTFATGQYEIEPYGRSSYVSGHHDGFTDAGGSVPLTVDDNNTDNWSAELGLRGRRWWDLENGQTFWLTLKGGVRSELLETQVSAIGTIAGAPQKLQSADSDPNAMVLGVKAAWVAENRAVLSINYEPVISGNWFYHSINADISYRF